MSRKFLFYISQNYSFEILRPLQRAIIRQGDQCAWYAHGKEVNLENFTSQESLLETIEEAIQYQPDAVFVPGNIVPDFISGLKVQVFHGLEYKKKGHFIIRGFFDMYCTQGPITTNRFNQLAQKHKYFSVIETGWPKLDTLFSASRLATVNQQGLPCILYAPTFSPSLTSAPHLLETITKKISKGTEFWIFKFHPKMDIELIKPYEKLAAQFKNVFLSTSPTISPALQTADVILSDTSSVIGEFLLLDKPAVTYKNSAPGKELINFTEADLLSAKLDEAINAGPNLRLEISKSNQQLHPFNDGKSSERILEAVEQRLIDKPKSLRKKPLNLFRRIKLRKSHNYWGF